MASDRGLMEHALLAALPPLAVAIFEFFLQHAGGWGFVLLLLFYYSIAFVLIWLLEKIHDAVHDRFPPRRPQIGRIDGWWIDLVRGLNGEILGGAIIHFQTSASHFDIRGTIYVLNDLSLGLVGWFSGKGSLTDDKTMGYGYTGVIHDHPDTGGGFITFTPSSPPEKDAVSMKGSFVGNSSIGRNGNGRPAYHFRGERPSKNTKEAARELLLDQLRKHAK
jgi:hypothetical protein